MVKAGRSKSRRESSRIIAEETGETAEAVHNKIQRGEKRYVMGTQNPQSHNRRGLPANLKNRRRRNAAARARDLTEGLPAARIGGGARVSDTKLIDQWRDKRLAEQCRKANAGRW